MASLRHTLHTEKDIESYSDHWSFAPDAFIIGQFDGFYEARLTVSMPQETLDVLRGLQFVQLTYRQAGSELGDLFYSDLFDGLTVHLRHDPKMSDKLTAFQGIKLLELMTSQQLASPDKRSAFIQLTRSQLFYNATANARPLKTYLQKHYPDMEKLLQSAEFVQVSMNCEAQTVSIRTIRYSTAEQEIRIPNVLQNLTQLRPELGIVRRQRRELPDSEFRGLSTYLGVQSDDKEQRDFTQFTIFFDQRVQPHEQQALQYRSRLRGSGSHLTIQTDVTDNQLWASHVRQLQAESCSLHAIYALPKAYFFDIFELQASMTDKWQLFGEGDLEAPLWKISGWGSLAMVDIPLRVPFGLNVPIHARYLPPNNGSRNEAVVIQPPKLFSRCPLPDAAFEDSPFDTPTFLTSLLGEAEQFRFYNDVAANQFEAHIAVADANALKGVTVATLATVLLGTVWIAWCCRRQTMPKLKKP